MATAIGLVVSFSSVAWADEPAMGGQEDMADVDDEDSDAYQKMLDLSAEGNEHYAEGRIAEAAAVYEEAHAAYPQPILLKNQMITRFLLEECETAIDLGEEFLETDDGSDQDRSDVEQVFGDCALRLAGEAAEDDDYIQAQDWLDFGEDFFYQAGNQEEAGALRDEVDTEIAGIEEPPEVDRADEDEAGIGAMAMTGWALTGVGVLGLAGGGIYTLRWNRQVSAMESAQTREEFDEKQADLIDSFSTARWAIPTLYGVGVTAAAAGVGLLVWSSMDDDQGSAMITPSWDGHSAGATFSLTF